MAKTKLTNVDLSQYVNIDYDIIGILTRPDSNDCLASFIELQDDYSKVNDFDFWSKFQWIAHYKSIEEVIDIVGKFYETGSVIIFEPEAYIYGKESFQCAFNVRDTKFPQNYWREMFINPDKYPFTDLNEMQKSYVVFLKKIVDSHKPPTKTGDPLGLGAL